MATMCELMCTPSASSAMELNQPPATISTTIITAVIHATVRVLRSATVLPLWKRCSCRQAAASSGVIRGGG